MHDERDGCRGCGERDAQLAGDEALGVAVAGALAASDGGVDRGRARAVGDNAEWLWLSLVVGC
jgi:hypothetical protein